VLRRQTLRFEGPAMHLPMRFGACAQRIHWAADLADAMAKARAHAGPSVIEIMTDPDYIG
jgi:thiamine pyrophosphate-dependent acetolactate synthase large subunit-like protein